MENSGKELNCRHDKDRYRHYLTHSTLQTPDYKKACNSDLERAKRPAQANNTIQNCYCKTFLTATRPRGPKDRQETNIKRKSEMIVENGLAGGNMVLFGKAKKMRGHIVDAKTPIGGANS